MFIGLLALAMVWIGAFVVTGEQSRCRIAKYIFDFFIIALVGQSTFLSYAQFQLWRANQFTRYFLPPYQSIYYFIQYTFFRHWSHFLVALIFSLIILFLAKYFNKRRSGMHFYDEEPYFLAIAILAVGYPGWLIYFSLMLLMPLLFAVGYLLFAHRAPRISYYHLWLPLAATAILVNGYLAMFSFWSKLII